jgi:hypothetical protein
VKTEDRAAPEDERTPDPEDRGRIRRGLLYCLWTFLALRLGLTILGLVGVALLPHPPDGVAEQAGIPLPVDVEGYPATRIGPGWEHLFTAFERFDALWFLRIAISGYVSGDGSAAFFPLYPLLTRFVSPVLGGHPLAAAILVSNLAAFGSLVTLYFLSASERGEDVARRAVLYLAVFPTAVFLIAPYSEAPFLLFALVALWAARRRRWAIAGLAGAAAAATRNIGVLLLIPLVAEAIHQRVEDRDRGLVGPLLWSVGPLVGVGLYLLYWRVSGGDWLAPLHQQANWQRSYYFPLYTLASGTGFAFRYPGLYPGGYHLLDWLVAVPALGAAVWAAVRSRPMFGLYAWAVLLAPLSYIFADRPLMSFPRFLLVAFPILWAPAVWSRRRPWVHGTWVAVSAALLGIVTLLFVNWYYVF